MLAYMFAMLASSLFWNLYFFVLLGGFVTLVVRQDGCTERGA